MATAELLVDTDVLVDHLRGTRRLPADIRPLAISVITRCELFAGRDEPELLRRFLSPMVELTVDAAIAELAGRTRRETGIATPDALIAATALAHRLPLMTRNRRHFDRVVKLRVVAPNLSLSQVAILLPCSHDDDPAEGTAQQRRRGSAPRRVR